MSARSVLAELEAAGIRLSRDGSDLIAEVLAGANLDRHRERIMAHKPVLVAALGGPVTATAPPVGWDGQVCARCRWKRLCAILGPRDPNLPGGQCPAWPADTTGADRGD